LSASVDDIIPRPDLTVKHVVAPDAAFLLAHCSFGNCDSDSANGCESDLTSDVNNCGGCGAAVTFANAAGACVNSIGVLSFCNTG
jgi:hypothetical protein